MITLKLKFATVKPASKQVSPFRVLFTRPSVLTIDTSIAFLVVFTKPYDRYDNLKLYSVFEYEFLIDHALNIIIDNRLVLYNRRRRSPQRELLAKKQEEDRWRDIPEWKRSLIIEKEKKKMEELVRRLEQFKSTGPILAQLVGITKI